VGVVAVVHQTSRENRGRHVDGIHIRDDEGRLARIDSRASQAGAHTRTRGSVGELAGHRQVKRASRDTGRYVLYERDGDDANAVGAANVIAVRPSAHEWFQEEQLDAGGPATDQLLFARAQVVPFDLGEPDDVHTAPALARRNSSTGANWMRNTFVARRTQ
jgi:hypothetical protein